MGMYGPLYLTLPILMPKVKTVGDLEMAPKLFSIWSFQGGELLFHGALNKAALLSNTHGCNPALQAPLF